MQSISEFFSISSNDAVTSDRKKGHFWGTMFWSKTNLVFFCGITCTDEPFTIRPAMDTFDLCSLCHDKITVTHVLVCLHVSSVFCHSSELQVRWRSVWRWTLVCVFSQAFSGSSNGWRSQCLYMVPRVIQQDSQGCLRCPEERAGMSVTSVPEHELLWWYFKQPCYRRMT